MPVKSLTSDPHLPATSSGPAFLDPHSELLIRLVGPATLGQAARIAAPKKAATAKIIPSGV